MSKGEYPELEKIEQNREFSQPAGEFLDWLVNERGIILAQYHKHYPECYNEDGDEICDLGESSLRPIFISIEKLLAEYFDIDLEKVEQERRKLLEEVRKRGEKK